MRVYLSSDGNPLDDATVWITRLDDTWEYDSQKMIELKKQDDRRWECDYSNITSVCVHMNSDDDVTVRLEVE